MLTLLKLVWICLLLLLCNKGRFAMKLLELRINTHTIRGNTTILECHYDLEGETLYAVKWYKDGNEFYRYLPRETPRIQVFDLPGINVDERNSNDTHVTLDSLELNSSGNYRCEVSAEAPSFQTVSDHQEMITVALPDKDPVITGGKSRYSDGEAVDMNCTSGRAKPSIELSWYINGEAVNNSYLRGPWREVVTPDGLEVTKLGLYFKVKREHFVRGDLKVRCLATLAKIYWKSNEENAQGERFLKAPVMEMKDSNDYKSTADRVRASSGSCVFSCMSLLVTLISTATLIR
uniref:Ig-like domain-containing protein n=1 Tax=Cacopsylla melanoneura TaxID=428564 RepID=A0A8D8YJG1_9HEMI